MFTLKHNNIVTQIWNSVDLEIVMEMLSMVRKEKEEMRITFNVVEGDRYNHPNLITIN